MKTKYLFIVLIFLFIISGCENRPSVIKKTHNGLVSAITTKEYVPWTVDPRISGQSIKLTAHKKGVFMVESWKQMYRDKDELFSITTFNVNKLPFDTVICFIKNGNDIESTGTGGPYRVEITYSDGHVMERKTVHF